MALDPIELLIVVAVVVVIFLWGPSKFPEMARSIGRAKREFDSAQKDLQEVTKQFQTQAGLTGITSVAGATSGGTILDRLTGLIGEPAQGESAPAPQLPQAPVAPPAPPAAAAVE